MYAVTGATGKLGQLVIQSLSVLVPSRDILALVRDPSKAAALSVPLRYADYDAPDSLIASLRGVNTLLFVSSNRCSGRLLLHANVVQAARKAKVRRVLYTSVLHADALPADIANDHIATEMMIRGSDMAYSILRNGWYNENITAFAVNALAKGVLASTASTGSISCAARVDYADAAAVIMTSPGLRQSVFELAGDEAFTFGELAAEVSLQSGRPVAYRNETEGDLANILIQSGLSEPRARAIARDTLLASGGSLYEDNRLLSKVIGRPTMPWSMSVTDALLNA